MESRDRRVLGFHQFQSNCGVSFGIGRWKSPGLRRRPTSSWCGSMFGTTNGMRAFATVAPGGLAAVGLPAQTFNTILSFDTTNGATRSGGLVQATDGAFYG
jgi:hypothetical protein